MLGLRNDKWLTMLGAQNAVKRSSQQGNLVCENANEKQKGRLPSDTRSHTDSEGKKR